MSSRAGSQPPTTGRLSQTQARKGSRPHPTFRTDANYGRLTGKLMNYGDLERDTEGFEDFNKYLNDDVFVSPPPVIPKAKAKSKTPARSVPAVLSDPDSDTGDEDSPQKYLSNASRATGSQGPSISKALKPVARRLFEDSAIDYDSIPAPKSSHARQTGQSSSSRPRPGSALPSTTKSTAITPKKSKGRALSTSAAGMNHTIDDDFNDTSNMSFTPIVASNHSKSTSGLQNGRSIVHDDDDDSPISRAPRKAPIPPPSPIRIDENDIAGDHDQPMGGDSDSDPEPFADHGMEEDQPPKSPSPVAKGKRKAVPEPAPPQEEEQEEEYDVDHDMPDVDHGHEPPDQQGEEEEVEEEVEPEEHRLSKKAKKEREKEEKKKKKQQQPKSRVAKENRGVGAVTTRLDHSDDNEDDSGPRRGTRQRFAPLEWWRGERTVLRRPRRGDVPVPIVDAIIRIPVDDEGRVGAKKRKRGTTKPPSSRGASRKRERTPDNPEEGWDEGTEENALVLDYETKAQIERRVAFTAEMVNPQQAPNAKFAFQKIFSDGEFIAGGVLNIPVHGSKPSKPSKDNTYLFYCVEGAVRVVVHRSSFIIATNGMFMIPRGNQYLIENVSDRESKLFFAQARKVPERLGAMSSPIKGGSARPSAPPGRPISQTPKAVSKLSTARPLSHQLSPVVPSPSPKKSKAKGTVSGSAKRKQTLPKVSSLTYV